MSILLGHLLVGLSQSIFKIQEEPCSVSLSHHSSALGQKTLFHSQNYSLDYISSAENIKISVDTMSNILS